MFSSLYFWVGVILGWVSIVLLVIVVILFAVLFTLRRQKQFTPTQQMQDMFEQLSKKGPGLPG
mgnify:FL=1